MASLEDECFLISDDDDLFSALGRKSHTDDQNVPNQSTPQVISRRQHRLQRAWAQVDCSNYEAPTQQGWSRSRQRWRWAFQQIRSLEDPWQRFHLEELEEERAVRHRYSALKKSWVEDEVRVKLAPDAFTAGAMRDCYRLKKLSKWVHCADWRYAANYVAKRYKEAVGRDVYFEDVRLQMEAKLWGEEFNRSNPPKKVDFVQMSVLEFIDRSGRPLFHLEHFIEGDYRKYNSNSGFVDDALRYTPQAFSHFTFERSGHQLMVIDIQGVGDLYTDPQVHTADGYNYGDGNLGARGMALFFHSHQCNAICTSLGLSRFDLTPLEERHAQRPAHFPLGTEVRGGVLPIGSPELCRLAAPTSPSFRSTDSGLGHFPEEEEDEEEDFVVEDEMEDEDDDDMEEVEDALAHLHPSSIRRPARRRYESSCSELDHEEDQLEFHAAQRLLHRPSCRTGPDASRILAAVHHALALLHRDQRFSDTVDWEAVVFHERHAAEMGCVEAMINVGRFLQRLPSDLLEECHIEPCESGAVEGFNFITRAAEFGDRSAMIFVASVHHFGNEAANRRPNWRLASDWYRRAVSTSGCHDNEGCYDATADHPVHVLLSQMGELHLVGGPELSPDPARAAELFEEAADSATAAMQGRFAMRMFERAEEARAAAED